MKISERIHNTIEEWQAEWNERLKVWAANLLSFGFDTFFKVLGNSFAPKLKPFLDSIEAKVTIPDELKPLFDEIKAPSGEVGAILAQSAGGALVGGAIGGIMDALFLRFTYDVASYFHPKILNESQFTSLWLRGAIKADELDPWLRKLGFDDIAVTGLKELSQIRLDPMSVITAWRRDPEKYSKFIRDLVDTGWDAERIEALKFITLFYPAPADLIRWQAREVFEPEMIARYGLDDEFGAIDKEPFYKAGMTDEQIKNYWRAHWEHASWMQVVEMLRRGQLTEEEVRDWFRVVEIPPFWRDKLIAISYAVPTRVDVRRWWDMRTISEERLREVYAWQGYHGKDLDDYVLWTKVYVAFPDLIARYKNGWLSEAEAKAELAATGLEEPRLSELWETKFKKEKAGRTTKERELTKSEIVKGVKKEVLSMSEGIELLMDMGYDEDEADYIMTINLEAASGSPESFAEFKDITQKHRRAAGMEHKPMTEELKAAAAEVVRLTGDVKQLGLSIEEEKRLVIQDEAVPEAATARQTELQVKLHRAEAELNAAKTHYDSLVAEWRHGEG